MKWSRGRGVFESPDVSAVIEEARSRWPRFDDAYAGLQWLLARQALTLGVWQVVGETMYRLYRQAGKKQASTPDIAIVYTVDENNVTIIAMRVEERLENQEEGL
jgi:hypothetical protein